MKQRKSDPSTGIDRAADRAKAPKNDGTKRRASWRPPATANNEERSGCERARSDRFRSDPSKCLSVSLSWNRPTVTQFFIGADGKPRARREFFVGTINGAPVRFVSPKLTLKEAIVDLRDALEKNGVRIP